MQVDHINENTIRVRIDKNELARRGLKVLDLLGDKNKIQHFFYSILDEIDTDHSFSQDAPVTFQVMPNNGGLDLLITKVSKKDQDNLSQLFDSDLEMSKAKSSSAANNLRKSFLDLEADDEDTEDEDADEDAAKSRMEKSLKKFQKDQAYSFGDIDRVTELADSLQACDLSSSLYFERGKFYLDLIFQDENYAELKPDDAWAIANEYGIKVKRSEMARIRTAGKCLIERDALGQLRHYFTKTKR